MFEGEFYQIIILAALVIGSVSDWRTREVPDWMSYALFTVGIILGILTSLHQASIFPFLNMLAGGLFALIVSLLFFYTGQWGGGDAKLLIGIGTLIGIDITGLTGMQTIYAFIVNSLIAGAVWGILYAVGVGLKNLRTFKKGFKETLYSKKITKIRWVVLLFTIFFFVLAIVNQNPVRMTSILFALLIFFTFYVSIVVKTVETFCMTKKIAINKLVEGDWIIHDVKVGKKTVVQKKKVGLEAKDLQELMKLYKKKKLKTVTVKEGVPFVPGFLFGYIVTLIWGPWFVDLVFYII